LVSSSSSADVVHTVLIVCSFLLVVSLSPKPYITGVGGTAASYLLMPGPGVSLDMYTSPDECSIDGT